MQPNDPCYELAIPYPVINHAKQIMLYLFFFATNARIITNI